MYTILRVKNSAILECWLQVTSYKTFYTLRREKQDCDQISQEIEIYESLKFVKKQGQNRAAQCEALLSCS